MIVTVRGVLPFIHFVLISVRRFISVAYCFYIRRSHTIYVSGKDEPIFLFGKVTLDFLLLSTFLLIKCVAVHVRSSSQDFDARLN